MTTFRTCHMPCSKASLKILFDKESTFIKWLPLQATQIFSTCNTKLMGCHLPHRAQWKNRITTTTNYLSVFQNKLMQKVGVTVANILYAHFSHPKQQKAD